jgi:bifunctional non-homologous end joining protein LigD
MVIAEAVRALPVDKALIDGEAVVLRRDGRSGFLALMTKRSGAEASLMAFDLLRLNEEDLRLRPLEARRKALMGLVAGAKAIMRSARRRGRNRVRQGVRTRPRRHRVGEGGFYRCGRSRNWLKTINPDVVRT